MNNRLQAQFQDTRFAPINRLARWSMCVMTGVFLLAFLFAPKPTYGLTCLGGLTVSSTTSSGIPGFICGSGTATLSVTGTYGTGTPGWSSDYQWYSSPDNVTWTLIPGASGVISAPGTVTGTYTTPIFTAGAGCTYYYYRAQLFSMTNACVGFGPTATSPTIMISVCPSAGTLTGPSTLCVGDTATWSSTVAGGTWTSTGVLSISPTTGKGYPISTTGFTVTYTVPGGCYATMTGTALYGAGYIAGKHYLCPGGTTALVRLGGGGSTFHKWSSSDTTVATVDSNTGIVTTAVPTPALGSTVTITYQVTGTLGGCYTTFIMTVSALPPAITGNVPLCNGSTTTLSEPTVGSWMSSNSACVALGGTSTTSVATGHNVTTTACNSTITFTDTLTGCATTTIMTVNGVPTITGYPGTTCSGSTYTLSGTPSPGTWSSSSTNATVGSSTGIVTGTLPGTSPGTAVITYTATATGCTATQTVSFNPLPAAITGPGVVCQNATILESTTTSGGTWTIAPTTVATISPVSSTSINVTGVTPGTATLSYTLATGCATSTVITVNAIPAAPVGPPQICVGTCVTFTDATSGGTWSSTNTAAATAGSSTGEVCGVSANTAFISYTLPTGCANRSLVTVNALPSNITGSLSLCVGSNTTLNSATPGGTWSSGTPSVADFPSSSSGVLVGGSSPGTTTVTYLVTATGCSKTAVATVNPNPATPTGTLLLCPGQCATLNDTDPGGTWSSGTTAVATIASGTGLLCGVTAGTSLISYTLTATGCRATVVATVNSSTLPITGTFIMCEGACQPLSNATPGGTWSSSSIAIATVTSAGLVCGASAGTATISYVLPTGCMAFQVVTINPLPPAIGGTLAVCVGASSSLSDLTTGGTWMSSLPTIGSVGSITGVLGGVSPGTTNITYTLPTSCYITAVATVYAVPSAITGNLAVCQGSTTALGSATPGGDWTSSNTAVATVSLSTGIVTGVAPGTATITYTTSGLCFTTAVVTVNPLPAAITGGTAACIGSCVTLSSTTSGGTWSSSNPAVATVGTSTGIACGVSNGTATITYMLSTDCYVTTVVTVSNAPSGIIGTMNACVGNTSSLSHATPGGTWSSSVGTIASIGSSSGVVSAILAGTTIISYILPGGCFVTGVFTVNAPPAAITGAGAVCSGSTLTLSSTTPGGTWTSSNTGVATVGFTTGIVTGVGTGGTATITYTITSTSCFTTATVTVNPSPSAISGTFSMCVSACTTLTDATLGGTWSSSNPAIATVGSSTGIVCGAAAGNATITYTTSAGCRAFATVTVLALPAPITGSLLICTGTSTSLSSTTPGGTWSLCGGTGFALVGSSTGLVTGITAGTVVICYTVGSGCSVSTIVTINSLPAPITGNLSICIGGHTTLSSTTPGGTWSSSNTAVATIGSTTGDVLGLSTGTSRITYTAPVTGCYVTADVTVNAAPPAITGPGTVCTGATITLADAASGGTWTSSTPTVGSIGSSSGIVTGITPGTTTIVYDVSAGCSTSTIVTVNLTPSPIAGSTPICLGSCITLSTTPPGGTWSSSNTGIATVGSGSGIACAAGTGTATISYIMSTGCFSTVDVTVNPLPLATTGTNSICQGSSTTLSNTTPGGGTWSSSNSAIATVGSSTGVVTGTGGGTVNITFTATATGCFTTFAMTINPLPAPIGGPLVMCEGSTITLTDATPGGIWNSLDPSIANINASTGEVLGEPGGGVTTITYTLGTGCFVTRDLTVNPLPLPITGTLSGCVGVPSTLSDPTAGGTWSATPPGTVTIGSASGIIIGSIPGTATVTYTLPTGCFVTAVYTVNPAPEPIAGTLHVCVGSCTTLTSMTPGGTWTSDNTLIATAGASTGEICGASAGTVTITYTASTGCYVTAVFSVYPIPPAYTGTLVICVGGTTTLSDIITGGTWSSAVPTVATVGSASGIVTGISGYGTSTITYTLPSSCFVTDVVTVNPLPAPISGDFEICNGTTTTLTDATPGGTWTSSSPAVATIDPTTGVVTALVAGVTTITYTLTATGCYVATTFIVDPLPDTIAGTKVVCVGQTTLLTDALTGGTWLSLHTSVATIGSSSGVVTGVSGLDTATILYTLPTGCSITTVVTVNPLPAPIVGPSTVCMGATITMTDATPGGVWSSTPPSVAFINPSTGVVMGLNAGTAIITYTNPVTGCFTTKIITVNPNPGSISGLNTMCLGLTTTLVASTHGGTWVSADTLTAKVIDTTASGDTIVVQGMAVGSTYITYTLPTGCFTIDPITVNPLPATIGGPSAVCVASTITLTDATAGGTWSVNPTTVATIGVTSGVVTGVSGPNTATVTYTNGFGCITTKVITVNPLPSHIYGPHNVCVGSTITLQDSTKPGTWSTVDTTIIGLADSVVTGLSMGIGVVTYTLTTTGCADTFQVRVHPLPDVTVNHPGMICRTASVLLTANGAGTGASYTWAPPTGLSCTSCQSTVANPTVTTTYTVTGATAFGCIDTAIVTVVVDSILNHIRIAGKDSICAGTCTSLAAEGFPPGSLFAWRPVTGLSCTICDSVQACPTATTTYYAIAIDSVGCRDSASITVHIMPLPVLDVLPRPAFVCKGDSTQLNAFSSVYGTTFAWYPSIFLTCDSCPNPIAFDTMNLVYRIIGTTPFGCYDSIRVPVSVLENTINTISADTTICEGQSVRLESSANASDGSASDYLWIPSTFLSNPHVRDPVATPTVTTTYTLVITPNACFKDTLQVTVKVDPYPQISITPPTSNVVAGTAVSLLASITNGVNISSYVWNPAQTLSCEACYKVIATPTVNTTYTFTATSNYGCTSSATATINIYCDNSQVFIPNTFTPNGDGVNDRFYVSAKGINLITRFSIFNRWGEMVYDAHNISPNEPSQGWDGTYKGMVLPPDVFVVIVDAVCELGGAPFHYKADVSIVR